MSDNMTIDQARARISELELDLKLAAAGEAGRAVAKATAAATAAGKQPLMRTEFEKMSPQKRMQLMRRIANGDSDCQLVDDRDV